MPMDGGDVAAIVTIWLAVTCAYGAASKIRGVTAFANQQTLKAILGARLAKWAAPAIVAGESVAALALMLGLGSNAALRLGSTVAATLFATFSAGLSVALIRGVEGTCGCFGESDDEAIGRWTLSRAIVLALASVYLLSRATAPSLAWPASIFANATIALGLVAFFRLLPYSSVAVKWLRQPAPDGVTPTTRLTFKYSPLDEPLFDGDPLPVNQASVLSSDRFFSTLDP